MKSACSMQVQIKTQNTFKQKKTVLSKKFLYVPVSELLAALLSVRAPALVRQVAHFLLRSVFLMRCGITFKAVSFWLRFVTRNEREQFNSLLCEADEGSKNAW